MLIQRKSPPDRLRTRKTPLLKMEGTGSFCAIPHRSFEDTLKVGVVKLFSLWRGMHETVIKQVFQNQKCISGNFANSRLITTMGKIKIQSPPGIQGTFDYGDPATLPVDENTLQSPTGSSGTFALIPMLLFL